MTEVVIGVDGARLGKVQGWVAVVLDAGGVRGVDFHATFADVLASVPDAKVVGVDMPLGLVASGRREADDAARKFLGARASSVFPVPPRPVLAATTYTEACARAQASMGKMISKQAWNIVPRIRELDRFRTDARVHEVHPEVSFQLLADAPLLLGKKTWGGQQRRRELLAAEGIVLSGPLGEADRVPPDDVLDAAVVAWTARRIAAGLARSFPSAPTQRDGKRAIVIRA